MHDSGTIFIEISIQRAQIPYLPLSSGMSVFLLKTRNLFKDNSGKKHFPLVQFSYYNKLQQSTLIGGEEYKQKTKAINYP